MTSIRKKKAAVLRTLIVRREQRILEDRLWDEMAPVGREFGSPDFDRLMAEDLLDNTALEQRRDESPNHLPVVLGR